MASDSRGRSFSVSGWTAACCLSEQKEPESHPPNNTTVPIAERCCPAGVRDLGRRVGHAINLNLFVTCKHQALPPRRIPESVQ